MKLRSITIKDFKGIDNLSFEPRRINLIVGRNNTGKTSVLDAIDLSAYPEKIERFSPYFSKVINVHSDHSEIGIKTEEGDISLRVDVPPAEKVVTEFRKEITRVLLYTVEREFRFRNKEKEPATGANIKKEVETLLENLPMTEDFISNLQSASVSISRNGQEKVYFAYDYENAEMKKWLMNLSELLSKRVKEKLKLDIDFRISPFFALGRQTRIGDFQNGKTEGKDVLYVEDLLGVGNLVKKRNEKDAVRTHEIGEYIKKHKLIDNLEGFNFPFFVFSYDKEGKYAVPYSFMGDGLKALVGLLWYLSPEIGEHKHKVILLEEPETHMHPGYIAELTRLLIRLSKELDLQFFITTHSIDFIESFFDERTSKEKEFLIKDLLVLRMEKDDKGYVFPEILNYEDSVHHIKDVLMDLRGT